jgi:hypothetical protein
MFRFVKAPRKMPPVEFHYLDYIRELGFRPQVHDDEGIAALEYAEEENEFVRSNACPSDFYLHPYGSKQKDLTPFGDPQTQRDTEARVARFKKWECSENITQLIIANYDLEETLTTHDAHITTWSVASLLSGEMRTTVG